MARPGAIVNALKSIPGGARYTAAPQSSGMGRINPVQANAMFANPYQDSYGPFLPRPSSVFTDGAFAPMSPIQPVPLDTPPPGGMFADPRWWQAMAGWNLPTQPGTEGLKLASFDQLYTLANRYSVARQCIELRKEEIRGLEWEISLTSDAAKAYQGDRQAMRDFGERKALLTKFFQHPDPDFWNFSSFLDALLEEIFVYDAPCVIFRPKYGATFGMGGRGLLGSDLDSINLVSGPTIRPLIDMHGGRPRPPAPAYQQYLYGVPRSDYMTIATGQDIDAYGLAGAEVNEFRADIMLYAPVCFPPGDAIWFPPGREGFAPDYLRICRNRNFSWTISQRERYPRCTSPPGTRTLRRPKSVNCRMPSMPLPVIPLITSRSWFCRLAVRLSRQRPVDLSDSFDYLVMNQVTMAFDVMPQELGIIPDIGQTQTGPSASGVRFAGQEVRDIKARKSTKPLLKYICDLFNYAIQDICQQPDIKFQFAGLVDDEDKQAITTLGVEQIQNGVSSIDEIRERLDLPPWGLQETSEPIVMTQQGPIPFSMAPQLLQAMMTAKSARVIFRRQEEDDLQPAQREAEGWHLDHEAQRKSPCTRVAIPTENHRRSRGCGRCSAPSSARAVRWHSFPQSGRREQEEG